MTVGGRNDGGGWVMSRVWWMGVAHAPPQRATTRDRPYTRLRPGQGERGLCRIRVVPAMPLDSGLRRKDG